MSRRSNGAGNTLAAAQESLRETAELLKVLTAQRHEALLTGTDDDVAAIDGKIEAAQRQQRTRSDRVTALAEVAEQEAAAQRVKEHAALIGRVEGKLRERDQAVAELAAHVAAADAALVKVFALNRAILAAWPWGNNLGAVLLGDGATLNALRNEIYRVSGRPPSTGGMPGDSRGPSYPGGQCERLEWIMMPEKTRPMTEKYTEARAAASVIMKTGRNGPAPETNGAVHSAMNGNSPTEQLAPSAPNPPVAPQKLSREMLALLEEQNALVSGPMDEAADRRYELISTRIRELAELEGAAQ